MTDNKSILAQAHSFLNIVSDLKVAEITLPLEFLVGVIIACRPKSWNGYKKKFKHDEKKYSIESVTPRTPNIRDITISLQRDSNPAESPL
ncbi:hypothetical protein BVC80_1009g1 [Macleaya cordata]|uniref:Uncharacterized protein n=1 Tax=Macleaya cordata TaxID=56857 RepID=A0A200QIW3_MACCD|nr:hypothetical protein BVC80_1009g1 [Macleaya cordata]